MTLLWRTYTLIQETNQDTQMETAVKLYSVVWHMEAKHIISIIITEVFEDISERR